MGGPNDFLDELEGRLANINDRKTSARLKYEREVAELDDEFVTIKKMIAFEEKRMGLTAGPRAKFAPAVRPLLANFFLTNLERENLTKEELKEMADKAGYPNAGRSTHATLLNLVRKDRIRELPNGRYALAPEPTTLGTQVRIAL